LALDVGSAFVLDLGSTLASVIHFQLFFRLLLSRRLNCIPPFYPPYFFRTPDADSLSLHQDMPGLDELFKMIEDFEGMTIEHLQVSIHSRLGDFGFCFFFCVPVLVELAADPVSCFTEAFSDFDGFVLALAEALFFDLLYWRYVGVHFW
jgi:hypothetical protein